MDKSVAAAKLADLAVSTAKIAAKAVTSAKLADTAVSDKLGLTYEGAVSDFGTLYVLGGKIGIMQVYCLKTAALAAWGSITAKLPGGYKSARSMAASLTCEDHHEREAICLVEGDTVRIQNRSSTAWTGRLHGLLPARPGGVPRGLDADHVAEDVQVVLGLQARRRGRGAGVRRHPFYGLV